MSEPFTCFFFISSILILLPLNPRVHDIDSMILNLLYR